jgi:hypothetical protein
MGSASALVNPSKLGGVGEGKVNFENPRMDLTARGLLGKEFRVCCPPDVQPDTRIIALCGINDYCPEGPSPGVQKKSTKIFQTMVADGKALFSPPSKRMERKQEKLIRERRACPGNASPVKDGWFFSDFFLFHHLFNGIGASLIPNISEKFG